MNQSPIRLATVLILASSLTVSGCGLMQTQSDTGHDLQEDPITALEHLSAETRDEMRILAKIAQAYRTPGLTKHQHAEKKRLALTTPAGFDRIVDMRFAGPAYVATEAIARAAGYEFVNDANSQTPDIWASIHIERQPVMEALREIGMQTGDMAEIQVYPSMRIIRYQTL